MVISERKPHQTSLSVYGNLLAFQCQEVEQPNHSRNRKDTVGPRTMGTKGVKGARILFFLISAPLKSVGFIFSHYSLTSFMYEKYDY